GSRFPPTSPPTGCPPLVAGCRCPARGGARAPCQEHERCQRGDAPGRPWHGRKPPRAASHSTLPFLLQKALTLSLSKCERSPFDRLRVSATIKPPPEPGVSLHARPRPHAPRRWSPMPHGGRGSAPSPPGLRPAPRRRNCPQPPPHSR